MCPSRFAASSYFEKREEDGWFLMDYYDLTFPWSASSDYSDGAHYGRHDPYSRCPHPPWMSVKHGFVDHVGLYTFVPLLDKLGSQ